VTAPAAACPTCGAVVQPGSRFCASCGTPLEPAGSEERKVATIVFADVIGSTDLGEQLDPERLRAVLQEYFGEMSRVIAAWGGTVEKYIGDAVVAVFGVPVAREDDATRALHAATEMLAALDQLNGGFEARHGVRLGIRIGVNTGEVLAPAGGRAGGQFLVTGDPVNVAARLEQAAEPGSVLVGERTWSAARDEFGFGEPTALAVKGKREPVVGRRLGEAIASEQRGVRFQTPMVGRERELQNVLGLLEEAVENASPRLAVITGPAGIGKSRLLRELIAAATDAHPDLTVLRGRCLAAGHGITFWALGEILRAACRISLDEPAESAAEKLTRTLDGMLAPLNLTGNEREETVFALATTANLVLAGNPLDRLEPERVGEAMARGWPRFLAALTLRSPVALVIEDLHWADERMVAMLELLSARSTGRLLLLATARPEFVESHRDFAASEDLTVVSLRPLTDAQSDKLVSELLGESDALTSLIADVRQKADGNPFFLEEILQRLIDEGALVRDSGRWRATEHAAQVRLPDTIHALLAARIDALPASDKAVIQQAAVVGRTFWPGSLGSATATTSEGLRSLERRGLIGARPTSTIEGEAEYIFRHVLIRDVAYASVPKSRRARAHAETAKWIEQLAGDRIEEFDELLAYHYAAAVSGEDADLAWADAPDERDRLRRQAFEACLRAGAGARHRFAIEKAIALDEQARQLAMRDADSARVHEALGDDHEALYHMDAAVENYFAAIARERSSADQPAVVGRLATKIATSTRRWGAFKNPPSIGGIRELIEETLARDIGEFERAELLLGLAAVARRVAVSSSHAPFSAADRPFLPRAIESAEEGLAIAKRIDDPGLLLRAYETLQGLYFQTDMLEPYRDAIERQLELVDRLPSRRQKADVLSGVAEIRAEEGRYGEALASAEQAFEQAAELSPHERMHTSFTLMWAAGALGLWDRALEVLPWHAQAAAAEADVSCPMVRGGPALGAIILARRGDRARALELVPVDERALDRQTLFDRALVALYATEVGQLEFAGELADRIYAQEERAQWPDGLDAYVEALALLGRDEQVKALLPALRRMTKSSAIFEPVAARFEGELLIKGGEVDLARPLLERALERFEALSVPFEVARTRELLARLADPPAARQLLENALETYRRLGALPYVARVEAALAELPGNVSFARG
jgi:class 3 adenylate cyclase/tetratricopeptide (TPR) repeat protein